MPNYPIQMLVVLTLGVALSGCKPAMATTTDTAAAICTDANFEAFLTRFSRDIAVQEKATADPLTQVSIDSEAQPEPRSVTKLIPLANVEWPVIPNIEASRSGGREVVVTGDADGGRQVLVRKPDSDDQQAYHFAKRPCWTLVRTTNDTI